MSNLEKAEQLILGRTATAAAKALKEAGLLASDLPEQKTLAELRHEVYDAWVGAYENEWPDDIHGALETWLKELHAQLKGLTPDEPDREAMELDNE